jgi:GNAT superfamily N-acetyltransferase
MAEPFSFSVTDYRGHEDEILAVRNRNRPTPQTRAHLDWRYVGEPAPQPPQVFWLRDQTGEPAAMAALIFRSYFVDGRETFLPVLGDISVEQKFRGQGLAKELFQKINDQVAQQNFPAAFVMPNAAAEKGLAAAGWTTVDQLTPLVCVTNPAAKFHRRLKLKPLAAAAALVARKFTRRLVVARIRPDVLLREAQNFDQEFDALWQSFAKPGMILRSRQPHVLRWRYQQHPDAKFTIHKFHAGDRFVGYVVSQLSAADGICLIEDFLVATPDLVAPCLARFLEQALANDAIQSVRLIPNRQNFYLPLLQGLGFVKRAPVTTFQILQPRLPLLADPAAWFVMAGDKDAL